MDENLHTHFRALSAVITGTAFVLLLALTSDLILVHVSALMAVGAGYIHHVCQRHRLWKASRWLCLNLTALTVGVWVAGHLYL